MTTVNVTANLARAQAHEQHLAGRLHAQLRFAELLCELRPAEAAAWRTLLRRAEGVVTGRRLDGASLPAVIAEVETILAPLAPVAKTYRVHGIGHAHIDMNWMWGWSETVAVVVDTVGTVLRLLDEFPEFHFTQSQAEIYRILAEHGPPEHLAAIRRHLASGRWEAAASHWVEGDKNLAGGESLCRQVLYAKRYLHSLLGIDPDALTIDWAPDTFGHPATMPTYLAQAGVRHCFLHRPGAHAEGWPEAFRWYGPDGAMTLVLNGMRGGYNGVFCPRMMLDRVGSWFRTTGLTSAPYLYGVGDHGGGPTRRDLLQFRDLATWPIFPTLQLGPAGGFFAELERVQERLPEVRGELNFAFAGCYTSQSVLKRANRHGEARLDDAERAAAATGLVLDRAYPAARLEAAWRNVLFSQFHDILPGSCAHDSRTFSHGLFQQSAAIASQVTTQALRALAAAVRTDTHPALPAVDGLAPSGFSGGAGHGSSRGGPGIADGSHAGDDREFVVCNLAQEARHEVVEATVWENARDYGNLPVHRQAFTAIAPDGTAVTAQILEKGTSWGHDFVRLAFPAAVQGLGWTHYTLQASETAAGAPGAWQHGRDDWPARYSFHDLAQEGVENALVRCELDPRSGGIRRLVCKRSGNDLIRQDGLASILEAGCERPHGFNAWAIDHTMQLTPVTCTGLRRVSNGPHVAAIEVRFTVYTSDVVLTYELRRDDPRLHLSLRILWREIGDAQRGLPFLRLAVPTRLDGARLTGEVPFGAATRVFTAGEVVPAQRWAMVTGQIDGRSAGLMLLNDGTYGHALDGASLRLNLLRSTYDPDPVPETGQHEFRLALAPCPADLSVAAAMHLAQAFEHPLPAIGTDRHTGTLPATAAFLQVGPPEVVVLAFKGGEDGSAVRILRLLNPGDRPVTAVVRVPGCSLVGHVCDLLERPLSAATLDGDGAIRLLLAPHALGTLRFHSNHV